jgi:dihydroflavonol-4-reductase
MRRLDGLGLNALGVVHSGGDGVRCFSGDVTRPETLEPIFRRAEDGDVTVIHAAGLISIEEKVTPRLYEVNVGGTKNVIEACKRHGVSRLVYVSSVHAIPEASDMGTISETGSFSPELVAGAYAKTKAEATRAVLDAAEAGLDAVVAHPSGIIGPYDFGRNYLVQMISDYVSGRLPAGVNGGYDFVDVRDVADGCLLAAENGRSGECYILSNRYCTIKDLFAYIRLAAGGVRRICVPVWLARAGAPVIELGCRLAGTRPLYTRYALNTLQSNGIFSHDKATAELGYRPRDLKVTVADTVNWLLSRV